MSARTAVALAAQGAVWFLVATHVVAPIVTAIARGGRP